MKRRKFLLTSGSALLGATGVESLSQQPVLGLSFTLNKVENKNPSNVRSVKVSFNSFKMLPQYIDQTDEKATIRIILDVEGHQIVKNSTTISLTNGETITSSDLGSAIPIVKTGINSTDNLLYGDITVSVEHSDITDSYQQSFSITSSETTVPKIVKNNIFIGNIRYDKILSLSIPDLTENWSKQYAEVRSSPAVVDDTVYYCDGSVRALNVNDGSEIWSYTSGDVEASPVVIDGTLYVSGESDNTVYAMNADDGSIVWTHENDVGALYESSPAVVDGSVYVGRRDGLVLSLDASTGSEEWRKSIGEIFLNAPAVVNGKVYVGDKNNTLYALDASDGSEVWSYNTANPITMLSPAVVDGVVYTGSRNLYALDGDTGSDLWSTQIDYGLTSPTVLNGTLYTGAQGILYALDVTDNGSEIWSYNTGDDQIETSPAVIDGTVYFGSDDGDYSDVFALDASDGSVKSTYTIQQYDKFEQSSPISGADGWCFVNRPGRIGNKEPIDPF